MKVGYSVHICKNVCIKTEKKLQKDNHPQTAVISDEDRRPWDVGW